MNSFKRIFQKFTVTIEIREKLFIKSYSGSVDRINCAHLKRGATLFYLTY